MTTVKRKKKKKNKLTTRKNLKIKIIFIKLTGLLIFNLIKLANIETILRIIVIIILLLILGLLIIFSKKKKKLCLSIMIILSIIYIFLNYTFTRVYNSIDNITKKVDIKGICLVYNKEGFDNLDALNKGDIAIVGEAMDEYFYNMALEIVDTENIKNKLVFYDDYFSIINALLNGEVEYAFLPENYKDIYSANSGEGEGKQLNFSILYTKQKLIESKEEIANAKSLDEPFTVLLMGSDILLDSYNADTLMAVTVNPKTLKVTMLSIPRDTYTTIACTGGKHKINASGWYGDSCVVKTVEKYLDIKIDYYAKINFLGIVDLVDALGGVEVDVPYAFCEQNSKREWGKSTVYVDSGFLTLNGEQALALSRNRHYWKDFCDKKYTSDGDRSDFTRGANQQLVIKAIISKLMTVRDINTFYKILDTIGDNMTTNMPKDTILSLYNILKNVVKRLNVENTEDIINIERLSFKNYITSIHISGLDLSTVVNYDESVSYVSKQMKKNLGLVKEDVITDFSFDINEEYSQSDVKFNKLTSNLKLLNNMKGKTLREALSYCSKVGINCKSSSNDKTAIVISQSIAPKTDLATIKGKTITLEVENTSLDKTNNKEEDKTDKLPNDKEEIDNNEDTEKEPTKDNEATDNKDTEKENDDNKDTVVEEGKEEDDTDGSN